MDGGDWLGDVAIKGAILGERTFVVVAGIVGVVGAGVTERGIPGGAVKFDASMTEGFQFGATIFTFNVGGFCGASTAKTLRHRSDFLLNDMSEYCSNYNKRKNDCCKSIDGRNLDRALQCSHTQVTTRYVMRQPIWVPMVGGNVTRSGNKVFGYVMGKV
jgi:hypothetical protein